jgi:hypothetical protein
MSVLKKVGVKRNAKSAAKTNKSFKPKENTTTPKNTKRTPRKSSGENKKVVAKQEVEKQGADKQEKSVVRRSEAAKMFRALIAENKLNDDQIFARVQDRFNIDDSKKGYIGWCRNKMKMGC